MSNAVAPKFEVGETIGNVKVHAFLPKYFADCECLRCHKHFKRSIASLNGAKRLKSDSSCKACRPRVAQKNITSAFGGRFKLEATP